MPYPEFKKQEVWRRRERTFEQNILPFVVADLLIMGIVFYVAWRKR